MTTGLETLTGEGWKETFLGGNLETEAEILKKYAQDIHLVQERNRKKSGGSRAQRALHAKIHAGIVNAEFRIDPNIPQHLQHGIFQPGKTYKAYVRLSNASGIVQPDTKRDLRGLAIRVFSTDEQGKEYINDLLMTSAPVSHARNVRQFMEFAKTASTRPAILFPARLIFAVGLTETVRMLWNIIKYSSRKVESLAKETYWSRGPFQLGQAALQFHAQPASLTPEAKRGKTDNYLREDLVERLNKSDVTFDIMAKLFVNEQKTPIEDGAVRWRESDSPPFRIAQLVLPQQDLGNNEAQDAEAQIQQIGFNPWNGAETFRPLGQLNRGRQPVYMASENFRTEREAYIPPKSIFARINDAVFGVVNRFKSWDKLPTWLSVLSLAQLRTALRAFNLYDTETSASRATHNLPITCPNEYKTNRSPDGSYNDLSEPSMGKAGTRFGRNIPLDKVQQLTDERILTPNPRVIAQSVLTRDSFKPATTLNILAAGWIQFMIHDWFSHSTTNEKPPFEIDIKENDDWYEKPMRVNRTQSDPTNAADPSGHPTAYLNSESPWWDGSQIYGRNLEIQHTVRSHQDGKLLVDERGLLPLATKEEQAQRGKIDAVEKVAFSNNWWLGLGLMQVIFTQEHNAICDKLKLEYPSWDDEQLFNKARLVNTALIAKIHTVEWTTAILGHPALQISMNANWWGLVGEKITKIVGRISESEILSGIPGSATNHFGVPYSLTEEFVSVYRMHPLLPDSFIFHSVDNGAILSQASLGEAVGKGARKIMEELDISDLFYSMGIAHPGAVTLMNYPNFLRNLPGHGDSKMDLAAVDILRDRERGVPRYNDFRKLLRLPRVKTFNELTPNPELAKKLETVYEGKIDDVDLMIGMFAEQPPQGFGFSDTAFRIFILMASRRLNSDRFFTVDFTEEVYTPVGFKWVADNNMRSVLLRHYPKLEPALRGSKNAFAPWNRLDA